MTDAAAFKEIRDRVTQHAMDLQLGKQRMDQFEMRMDRNAQAFARAEGESKAEFQNVQRALDRLFGDMNQIKGGIFAMKWIIPLSIALVGGVSTFVLTLVLNGG